MKINYTKIMLKYFNNLEIVKVCVENGANIHANREYALRLASTIGHLEVVKYLESKLKEGNYGETDKNRSR